MMSFASSEEVRPLLVGIVLSSSVVIADFSNQLTTVGVILVKTEISWLYDISTLRAAQWCSKYAIDEKSS